MRARPRTPRRFDPLTDTLEERVTVSSLIPGLSAAPGRIELGDHRDEAAHQPVVHPRVPLTAKPVFTSHTINSPSGGQGVPVLVPTLQPASAERLASGLITVSTPSSPSAAEIPIVKARHQSPSVASPHSGGTALNAPSSFQAALANAAAPTPTSVAASAPVAGGIRPMTLAPSTSHQSGIASLSPMDMSGGSGGSGGSDTPPIIKYNGSSTGPFVEIDGSQATISVEAPAGKSIATHVDITTGNTVNNLNWQIHWEFYKSQDAPTLAAHGFVNRSFTPTEINQTSITGYWGRSGGTDIQVDVDYTDGTHGTADIPIQHKSPVLSTNIFTAPSTGIHPYAGKTFQGLWYGDPTTTPQTPGITWKTTITDSSGFGGTVKTVQTIDYALLERNTHSSATENDYRYTYWAYRDAAGQLQSPRPLLDDGADGSVFYEDSFPPGVSPQDSPNVPFDDADLGSFESAVNFSMMAAFTDTVMYQPPGGIWVPETSWSWNVNATANVNVSPPTSNDLTPPAATAATSTSIWPSWVDYSARLKGWVL